MIILKKVRSLMEKKVITNFKHIQDFKIETHTSLMLRVLDLSSLPPGLPSGWMVAAKVKE